MSETFDGRVFEVERLRSEASAGFEFEIPAVVEGSGASEPAFVGAEGQPRITATVGIQDSSRTFGSLTLAVEASDDLEAWETVATLTFTAADVQRGAPIGTFNFVRVTWEAEPRAQWRPRVRWSNSDRVARKVCGGVGERAVSGSAPMGVVLGEPERRRKNSRGLESPLAGLPDRDERRRRARHPRARRSR